MAQVAKQLPKAVLIPLPKIKRDPDQPRIYFAEDELTELQDSIRQHGLKNPIFVRPDHDETGAYILVAGERRWTCCTKLGWKNVPAFVESNETDTLVWQIIENTQRANLNAIEEARGYKRLKRERGLNQTQIARLVSKSQPHVSTRIALLKLPDDLQDLVAREQLSIAHGVELVRRCKSPTEMRTVVRALVEKHGNASKISLAALRHCFDERDRRRELGERKIDPDFVFEREFTASLAPVSMRLLGLLNQLVGEEGMPALSLAAFRRRWAQVPRVERTKFLAALRAIAGRIGALNAFLKQVREEDEQQVHGGRG